MDSNHVYVKKYYKTEENPDVFPIDEKEVWRYAGYRGGPSLEEAQLREVFTKVYEECANAFSYTVCYARLPLTWEGTELVYPFRTQSKALANFLKGCEEVVLFAATVGQEIDRHILRNEKIAPTKALLCQAYGAERVEALCDAFAGEVEEEMAAEGLKVINRFSPGYGDLSLDVQKDFFRILDISHRLGISLGDSMLMRPSKSVTAILGLKKTTDVAL